MPGRLGCRGSHGGKGRDRSMVGGAWKNVAGVAGDRPRAKMCNPLCSACLESRYALIRGGRQDFQIRPVELLTRPAQGATRPVGPTRVI